MVTTTAINLQVLIIAGDPLARAGLAMLLGNQPGYHIAGQINGTAESLVDLAVYQPDVILWDLGWNPEEQLDQAGELTEDGFPILALLADETLAAEAWRAGLRGLLLRNTELQPLLAALQAVGQNLIVLDPALVEYLTPAGNPPTDQLVEPLTPRELEVLHLLAEGLPNKAIARQLDISDHTVKFHVNALMNKLNAQSRTEAVVRATRLGLILL